MRISVTKNNVSILGEDNTPALFKTVKDAINYLANRNYTLQEIRELDFNFEEVL